MTRGLAAVAVAVVGCGVVMWAAYGLQDGLITSALLALSGAVVIGASHVFARRRRRVGSLSRQFQVAVALVAGIGAVTVGIVALLMFVSSHDALLMTLLLLFSGVVAAYSASLMAGAAIRDVESVRDRIAAVGDGRRDIRCATSATDELAELAAAANRMIEQLAEGERRSAAAWAAHRELIAAVSHDLRTPLASLQVLAEAIGDDIVEEQERAAYARQMSAQVRALSALVDDLFELSRLRAGDVQWSLQTVQLDELVEETVEAMTPEASASGVTVRFTAPQAAVCARANPEKVQRVLFNLIQNAIRHTPSDGSITIAAEPNGTSVEVEVADSGEAIPADDRERVFEPFYRGGQEAARTRKGAGLGLTICRAIVEAHGGRIWLADSDSGTRIRFSLPLAA